VLLAIVELTKTVMLTVVLVPFPKVPRYQVVLLALAAGDEETKVIFPG